MKIYRPTTIDELITYLKIGASTYYAKRDNYRFVYALEHVLFHHHDMVSDSEYEDLMHDLKVCLGLVDTYAKNKPRGYCVRYIGGFRGSKWEKGVISVDRMNCVFYLRSKNKTTYQQTTLGELGFEIDGLLKNYDDNRIMNIMLDFKKHLDKHYLGDNKLITGLIDDTVKPLVQKLHNINGIEKIYNGEISYFSNDKLKSKIEDIMCQYSRIYDTNKIKKSKQFVYIS